MKGTESTMPGSKMHVADAVQMDEQRVGFARTLDEVRRLVAPFLPSEILFKVNMELWRLYYMHEVSIRGGGHPPIDRRQAGSAQLELESEVRLAELEYDAEAAIPNTEQLASNLRWLIENGLSKNIDNLQRLEPTTRRISAELDELRQDAERAIIWRASAKPERWLEALRFAGPEEQVWLVTSLISQVLVSHRGDARSETGGTLNSPARALIPLMQENALFELLLAEDEKLRAETIYALGEAGGGDAVPILAGILRGNEPVRLRRHAAVALGRIGGPAAVQVLMEVATPGEDERVGFYALNSLRNLLPTGDGESARSVRQFLEALFEADSTPSIMREVTRQALEPSTAR